MNDFTKKELEEIYYRLENAPQELEDKIQAMIDNYCEHEFQVKSLAPYFLMMCEKCDKTFIDGSFPG